MSDFSPTNVDGPTVDMPGSDDPLAPPDDFGAAVLAEFERRDAAVIEAADGTTATAPPGGGFPARDAGAADIVIGGESDGQEAVDAPAADEQIASDDSAVGAEPPAVVDAPAAGTESAPPAADDLAGTADTPAPSGYAWTVADPTDPTATRTVAFTDDEVQRALSVAAWAESLPDPLRGAIGALEAGTAVALPRAEYDEFNAWRNQRDRGTRDADLTTLDVDPQVAAVISDLRDQVAQLSGGAGATSTGATVNDPAATATLNANLDNTARAFEQATALYAQERGLAPAEVEALLTDAVNANIIPSLTEAGATRNPVTGALLRPADIHQVAQQALDFALVRNPALHERVIAGSSAPATPAPAASATPDPVVAKRARAASLASAPSAATSPAPRNPSTLSQADVVAAMAKDLEAVLTAPS